MWESLEKYLAPIPNDLISMRYDLGIEILKTAQSFKMCTKILKPVL